MTDKSAIDCRLCGTKHHRYPVSRIHNIPARVEASTVMLTRSEYERHYPGKTPITAPEDLMRELEVPR